MDLYFRNDTFELVNNARGVQSLARVSVVRGDTPEIHVRFVDPDTHLAVDPFGEARHAVTLLLGAADLVDLAPAGTEDGAMTYDGFALYVEEVSTGVWRWVLDGAATGDTFTGTTAAAAATALAALLASTASGATVYSSGSIFTYSGTALATIADSVTATWLFSAKAAGDYGSDPLTSTTSVTRNWDDVADPYWVVTPNLNTSSLNTALGVGGATELAYLDTDAQLEATVSSVVTSTQRFTLRVNNDVARTADPLFSESDPWPFPIVGSASITGAITLTKSSFGIVNICSGSSANYTINLPDPTDNAGKTISFIMSSSLTKLVTLNAGSASIDGATARIMWAGESCNLYCDGTNYFKTSGKSRPLIAQMTQGGAAQTVANSTLTKVTLDTVVLDNSGMMTWVEQNAFYALRPGVFRVTGKLVWDNVTISRAITTLCLTSVGGIVSAERNVAGNYVGEEVTALINVSSASDTFTLCAFQSSGSGKGLYVGPGTSRSRMDIVEIPQW